MKAGSGALVFALVAVGCSRASYTPPPSITPPTSHEVIVQQGVEDTWTNVIDYASRNYFSIETYEKASGLMTLSFGSSEPWNYIDCGQLIATEPDPAGNDRAVWSGPYAKYLAANNGATLSGKMNIFLKAMSDSVTLVRASARYIFHVPGYYEYPAVTWLFDSGGDATVNVPHKMRGTTPTRTCRPTYLIEDQLLRAIAGGKSQTVTSP